MEARENECQISQNDILHMKFSEFYLCFHNSCEIWHSFSWPPLRNSLWCLYRWLSTSLNLEKCKKICNILYIILVQGFCPRRIKITQFPVGFRHNNISKYQFTQVNRPTSLQRFPSFSVGKSAHLLAIPYVKLRRLRKNLSFISQVLV